MPGFTTHYLFGLNTYKRLACAPLKQIIRKHHQAYSLGLQGPDLFFYFLPSYAIHKNNIGAVAHTEKTNLFLRHLLLSRKLFQTRQEQEIAEAYIAGFLGHYTLDTHCHPYVYWKTEFKEKNSQYHGRHMGLETEIDTKLLQFYKHLPPSAFRQDSTIALSMLQKRTITKILHYVYHGAYPELGILPITMRTSIRSIQMGTKFVHDPSGKKKAVIETLEKLFLGHPLFSTLIPSSTISIHTDPLNLSHQQWKNPWDDSLVSRDSFFDLMHGAQKEYLTSLTELNSLLYPGMQKNPRTSSQKSFQPQQDAPGSKGQKPFQPQQNAPDSKGQEHQPNWNRFLKNLGNLSYHSGLDAGIPS